jgi:hypothetical protein
MFSSIHHRGLDVTLLDSLVSLVRLVSLVLRSELALPIISLALLLSGFLLWNSEEGENSLSLVPVPEYESEYVP